MNPDAIREVLAIHVQGAPAESISFGATVTIICGNEVSAARWLARTPDGVLPVSRVPVQVVCMNARQSADDATRCDYFSTDTVTKRGRYREDGWRCGEESGHPGSHILYTLDGERVLYSASWAQRPTHQAPGGAS